MKKKYIYFIIGISIFIFSILILMISPIFNIEEIEINGLNRVEESQIIRLVGLDQKSNLLAFNSFKAKATLKENYYIKSVKITKSFPNKIIFDIEEREIAGYIAYINDYLYIDKYGYIVDIQPNYTEKLPLITGIEFDSFTLGSILQVEDEEVFDVVMKFTSALDGREIVENIFKIDVSNLSDIHLYIGKVDVLLGNSDDINIKINILIEVMKNLDIDERGYLYLNDINANPLFELLT